MTRGRKIRMRVQGAGMRMPVVVQPAPAVAPVPPEYVEFETCEGCVCLRAAAIYKVERSGATVWIHSSDESESVEVDNDYRSVLQVLGRTPKVCGS